MSVLPRFRFNVPEHQDFIAGVAWAGLDFRAARLDLVVTTAADPDGAAILTASTEDGRIEARGDGAGFDLRIPASAVDDVPFGLQRVTATITDGLSARPLFVGSWSRLPQGSRADASPVVFDGVRSLVELEAAKPAISIDAGAPGRPGRTIVSGEGVPAAWLGVPGDYFIDTAAHRLFGPKTTAGWGSGLDLVGPAGANTTAAQVTLNGPDFAGLGGSVESALAMLLERAGLTTIDPSILFLLTTGA